MWARSRIRLAAAVAGMVATALYAGAHPGPDPLPEGPIHYFQAHCARCHGKVGSPANTAFENAVPESDLRKLVRDMASGPGGAPLTGRTLDAQVALHRTMIAKKPFLDWTGFKGDTLTGEAVPGSVVTARFNGRAVPAAVSGFAWSVRLPSGAHAARVVLLATRGGRQVRLDLARNAFTGGSR